MTDKRPRCVVAAGRRCPWPAARATLRTTGETSPSPDTRIPTGRPTRLAARASQIGHARKDHRQNQAHQSRCIQHNPKDSRPSVRIEVSPYLASQPGQGIGQVIRMGRAGLKRRPQRACSVPIGANNAMPVAIKAIPISRRRPKRSRATYSPYKPSTGSTRTSGKPQE